MNTEHTEAGVRCASLWGHVSTGHRMDHRMNRRADWRARGYVGGFSSRQFGRGEALPYNPKLACFRPAISSPNRASVLNCS